MRTLKTPLWLLVGLLLLTTLACALFNGAGETPSPTPEETLTEVSPEEEETEAPPEEAATEEPEEEIEEEEEVTGEGGCSLKATFLADVTVPDDTEMQPGESFVKTWRLRNSGTCTWETGTQLVFVSEHPLGGPPSVSVPRTTPNGVVDVSVEMVAPESPDTYRSNWQLQAPDGTRFGGVFFVQIVVPEPEEEPTEPPTEEPTEPPTEEPTEPPTEEAAPPDLVITHLEVDTDDPRQGIPLNIVATLRNNGETVAENVRWAWRVCVSEGCEFTEAPGAFTLNPGQEIVASMEYLFNGWANYTTEAWVDSREEIAESDEDNNRRQLVIPVQAGKPDLVITEVTYDPDPPVQGNPVSIRVVVQNQGSKEAGAFKVEWWSSVNAPDPRCTWSVNGGLTVNESKTLTCSYTYPSWYGTITTRTLVDTENAIDELDETNNRLDISTPVHKP
ncbi:MAG: NBR1-Ig-like domain-containing protein [Anaerolineae bacterium]